ncbi:hypothetical protein ACVWXU_002928 [Streptomyces sp. TE33382]
MHARDGLDLGGERTDVRDSAAVDADLVLDDALADQLLGQRAVRGGDLLLAALEGREQLLGGDLLDAVQLGLAVLLAGDGERLGELGGDRGGEGLEDVVLVVQEDRELADRLGGLGGQVGLGLAERLDEGLRGFQTGGDDLLGGGLGAVLDELDGLLGGLGPRPS